MRLQLDLIERVRVEISQPMPHSPLRPNVLRPAGILQRLPFAGNASYLAIFDLVHVDRLAVISRRQPGQLVLIAVPGHIVLLPRHYYLRLVRNRPSGRHLAV